MSSSMYYFLAQEINIYCGLFILILGIFGGLLNVLVFTTLKTFRKTSCVFYLIVASIVDVVQLLTSLLIRILSVGFHIDPTSISWICKLRVFSIQFCALISLTCMSLAAVDQFMSLSNRRMSNLNIAHRNIIIASVLMAIHGIFFAIYYDTSNGVCMIINSHFGKYFSYFYFPILLGFTPVTIMITFAIISFLNIRSVASRQIHIERLSRDRQITAMVLVQVVCIIILTVPYIISNIYSMSVITTDEVFTARMYLLNACTILAYYGSYATPFYVFCCVSKRFRKQVVYVLIDIHFKRFQKSANNLNNNQVAPGIENKCPEQILSVTVHHVTA